MEDEQFRNRPLPHRRRADPVNRDTQELTPSWPPPGRSNSGGRRITFRLRPDVKFSDGTPFSADDVAYTMKRLMDPKAALRHRRPVPVERRTAADHGALDRYRRPSIVRRAGARAWSACSIRWRSSRRTRPQDVGRAGTVSGGRVQARGRSAAEPQSELLEARRERPAPSLPRSHPPGDSAESRTWSWCASAAARWT